jgi:hypothetical protein
MNMQEDFSKIIRDAAARGGVHTTIEDAKKLDRFCEMLFWADDERERAKTWDHVKDWDIDEFLGVLGARIAAEKGLTVFLEHIFASLVEARRRGKLKGKE